MPKKIVLRVVGERASDIHRTRNFAEELHAELHRTGFGTTADPDGIVNELWVELGSSRVVGEATRLMNGIIKKHLMQEDIQIEKP